MGTPFFYVDSLSKKCCICVVGFSEVKYNMFNGRGALPAFPGSFLDTSSHLRGKTGVPLVAQWKWIHLVSMRMQVPTLALLSGLGDPVLPWLWRRPAATAPTGSLAWEPSYAAGAALKRQKTKKKKYIQFAIRQLRTQIMPAVADPNSVVLETTCVPKFILLSLLTNSAASYSSIFIEITSI